MPEVIRFNRFGEAGMEPPFSAVCKSFIWAVQSINAAGATRWN